ncbi:MAG TPA: hypothetical protein VNG33_21530 [Polyangiaceae bacterium]|nr:hypothetical protein [Polyangiaceae bacterium]
MSARDGNAGAAGMNSPGAGVGGLATSGSGGVVTTGSSGAGGAVTTASAGTPSLAGTGNIGNSCDVPAAPENDPRCGTDGYLGLPGQACPAPGLRCFYLDGPGGGGLCMSPTYVRSVLCCENGWLERAQNLTVCPTPVANQMAACPPALPTIYASCESGLACSYDVAPADQHNGQAAVLSFCCGNGHWVVPLAAPGGEQPGCGPQ